MCQYDVRSSYLRDTKTGSSNGYFLLKNMLEPILLYFNLSKKVLSVLLLLPEYF